MRKAVILSLAYAAPLAAQSYNTIYNFQGPPNDISGPAATLTLVGNGELYGTSYIQGIFQLAPPSAGSTTLTETMIANDFVNYWSSVTVGPDEALYGTEGNNAGAVFQLIPPKQEGGSWTLNYIYYFTGAIGPDPTADGGYPEYGVVVGPSGVLYGTTSAGGTVSNGTIFQVTPPASPGGEWTESIIYNFPVVPGNPGLPHGNLTLGPDGSLYGTTWAYGVDSYYGEIYQLTPPAAPGDAWTYNTIYSFNGPPNDGTSPIGTLALDSDGVLYGVTYQGGTYNFGTIFSLTPPTTTGASWTETVLYSFTLSGGDGAHPDAGPILGRAGKLYGVTQASAGHGGGTVWSLAPPASPGGAWTLTTLHRFASGTGDIQGALTRGPGRTIYGVTTLGGPSNSSCLKGCGTVFEIAP